MKHVNAKDVFPPEIVKEIQKHYSGGYLWIPQRERNEEVAARKKPREAQNNGKIVTQRKA